MIQFIGLFDKQMKEFVEMLYLTEKPVVLSGEKYEKCIGELPKTSYYDGLKETIMYMKTDVNKEVKFLFMILKRNLTLYYLFT